MDNRGFEKEDPQELQKNRAQDKPPESYQLEEFPQIPLDDDPEEVTKKDDKEKATKRVSFDPGEVEPNPNDEPPNYLGKYILRGRGVIKGFTEKYSKILKISSLILIFILYMLYLLTAISHTVKNELEIDFCDGLGFLLILTGLVYWSLLYYYLIKPRLKGKLMEFTREMNPDGKYKRIGEFTKSLYVKFGLISGGVLALVIFLLIDTEGQRIRLRSAAGAVILILMGLVISKKPGHIRWRQVLTGLTFQFLFGLLILRWDVGRNVFRCASLKVKRFLEFTDVGSTFIYGYLAQGKELPISEESTIALSPIFAFKSLSIIFFFSFFINILYYYGIMQWISVKIGWILQIMLGTTAAESLNAATNIFVGLTESPLIIKPFLPKMTKSELNSVMTSGFATIAGTVLGAYISFGIDPAHLISASVMAAPASLAFAKLIYPETEISVTTSESIKLEKIPKSGSNVLDAAAQGAIQGGYLIGGIIANIIGFIAFISFANSIISWFGTLVGLDFISFEWLLSKLFIPFAWIIGIEWEDIQSVALLLGLKTIINEFVAYQKLTTLTLSARSRAISTYALCSFANFGSIGIQLGGLGSLVPERRADLANGILYAFVAGSLAGLLNACIAGTLLSD